VHQPETSQVAPAALPAPRRLFVAVARATGQVELEIVGSDQVLDVQEGSAVHADVDEGGLHARKHARHLSEDDIAHCSARRRALELQLRDDAVFDQSDARLPEVTIDYENISACSHGGWRPLPPGSQAPRGRLSPEQDQPSAKLPATFGTTSA